MKLFRAPILAVILYVTAMSRAYACAAAFAYKGAFTSPFLDASAATAVLMLAYMTFSQTSKALTKKQPSGNAHAVETHAAIFIALMLVFFGTLVSSFIYWNYQGLQQMMNGNPHPPGSITENFCL